MLHADFFNMKNKKQIPVCNAYRPVAGQVAGKSAALLLGLRPVGFRLFSWQRLNHYCPRKAAHWLQT